MRHPPTLHRISMGLLLLALGCGGVSVSSGVRAAERTLPISGTQAELRAALGAPDAIRISDAGQQLWEYAPSRSGPAMEIRFDGEGRVEEARWLRLEADFARVLEERSTMAHALALLGQPEAVATSPGGVSWRYRRTDGSRTFVVFGPDDRVTSLDTRR
jgi:hypothetical protein